MSQRRLALAIAIPLTLALAACGGGSPQTEPASDTAAAHEYDSFSHDELVAAIIDGDERASARETIGYLSALLGER